MNKKQVIDFLYNVIKDEENRVLPIIRYVSDLHKDCPCEMRRYRHLDDKNTDLLCIIRLNRKWFLRKGCDNQLKGFLLHEIGHCFFEEKTKYRNELYAQMWAIDKADAMGLKRVRAELIGMILDWGDMSWGDYKMRRYIIASKQFKETIEWLRKK